MTLCSGFINLDVINNGFRILNCENLNRIEGFNSLNCIRLSKNANGYQGLTIDNCKNLKKIVGFNNLESIIGPFYLDHIDKLESIEGFRKLKKSIIGLVSHMLKSFPLLKDLMFWKVLEVKLDFMK